ncbi:MULTISPECIES: IclR family transcriptional regulator [Shouchella]|uniref:IclR family transcriptional regulator n=2 Tax=Shouchella TaxID=2893057 RepID=A0ABY7W0Z5_9BACI|nr:MULTISPECIES: IclR family transcriptional regulator [Shouchella]MED4128437.1 IclR family transcriptional regulator [Shouchella miscanthi]WDF02612.1 IclR family transcriptional regulator [Shouchella hunanensis]GAF20783.1 transcriptional regulator, IclR family [Bacillus sp. JCM 19047]
MEKRDSLRTVRRALSILDCFSFQNQELSLTQIATEIELAKSTTTRLLTSLETEMLVQRDEKTGKYKLGTKLIYLGQIAKDAYQLKDVMAPLMKQLRDETLETVNLYTVDRGKRVCILQFEGYQPLRHAVRIGELLPLHAGAGGKVLLAYQSEQRKQKSVEGLTTVEQNERLADLQRIKESGIAISIEEREIGLAAVAVAVPNRDGSVTHCLSISGLVQRFSKEKIKEFEQRLKDVRAQVERD